MFRTICDLIPWDPALPARARMLDIRKRILNGTLYDVLPYEFHEERSGAGDYIPLRERRPSVRYSLPRMVVEDSVALLFSEGHFPAFHCQDAEIQAALAAVVKATRLNAVMIEAAIRGSIGSAAILMRILGGRLFFDVLDTTWLTPAWNPHEPDTLARVTERYLVKGRLLQEQGYANLEPTADYWFQRNWDCECETWYEPMEIGAADGPVEDASRTVRHQLGFVPIVWVRNLPGGDAPDGGCTFAAAIESSIEIDYQLSQAGRGLKYSSDPTLLIKEPALGGGSIVKGAGNALVLSEKGDARLLEIGGTASAAVIEYVRCLREYALESVHGNRASADRITAAQSGRALELMNQGLVWLADNLRVSYGEGALVQIAEMVVRATQRYAIKVGGKLLSRLDPDAAVNLVWPRWYPSSAEDRQRNAQSLGSLMAAGQISRSTAVRVIADDYDIADVEQELARIESERSGRDE